MLNDIHNPNIYYHENALWDRTKIHTPIISLADTWKGEYELLRMLNKKGISYLQFEKISCHLNFNQINFISKEYPILYGLESLFYNKMKLDVLFYYHKISDDRFILKNHAQLYFELFPIEEQDKCNFGSDKKVLDFVW